MKKVIHYYTIKKAWMTYFQNKIFASIDSNQFGLQTTTSYGNNAVIFKDTLTGWLGGTNISKTTDGGGPISGITNNSEQIAKDFKLYQNYPNPFNPSTSIKYKVESSKQIKLVIYNILGKEITTLINQKQKAGEYEVTFDAGNLTSGVYLYSLFADEIRVDTKKMVLIK